MGTVTVEEKEAFDAIRTRLMKLLEKQITHFRYEHIVARCYDVGSAPQQRIVMATVCVT